MAWQGNVPHTVPVRHVSELGSTRLTGYAIESRRDDVHRPHAGILTPAARGVDGGERSVAARGGRCGRWYVVRRSS
eukprot:2418085-Prymnesium_polylepis.1